MRINLALARRKKRIFEIIEVGAPGDYASRIYDFTGVAAILINLVVTVAYTFEGVREACGETLLVIESVTVAFFAIDYLLRLWTVRFLHPNMSPRESLIAYLTSFTGIVDLCCFLPYYLPFFFPAGSVAFRMLRIIRVFRLFRINAYYDSLNVITDVLRSKAQQLISSVFIILVLILASSLFMYSLEHEAQPEVFANAFSGIWWAVSTLLTVGYGDIYPITPLGQSLAICITFLGVGMVAIPTAIISAGFVEQYSRLKRISELAHEEDIHFMKIQLFNRDHWVGMSIRDLNLPHGMIVAAIQRGHETIVPRGDVVLRSGDALVLGAEPFKDDRHIDLKEVVLRKQNPWNGLRIRDLDISRQTLIVMVKRKNKMLIPNGDLVLMEGDTIILYSQKYVADAHNITI